MSETVENRDAQSCCVEAIAETNISDWDSDSQPQRLLEDTSKIQARKCRVLQADNVDEGKKEKELGNTARSVQSDISLELIRSDVGI
jgi:hypothetical protein